MNMLFHVRWFIVLACAACSYVNASGGWGDVSAPGVYQQ